MVDTSLRVPTRRAVAAFLLVTLLIGRAYSQPAPAKSITASMTREQLDRLSPSVRQLLSDIESGQANGALATTYSAALQDATKSYKTEDGTDYLIVLDGHKEAESHPSILLTVRAADGRISSYSVGVPCW